MSYLKPYASYFRFVGGFDTNAYVNDILLECVNNNITDPEKCCASVNLQSSHPDYNLAINKLKEFKKLELEAKKCIDNNINKNDCINNCKKTNENLRDYGYLYTSFNMMFDRMKAESKY